MKEYSTAKSIKKRLARILFYLLLVIISLPIALTILFRSPLIQTLTARLAIDWMSTKIDRKISLEAISFSFYDGIYLSGLELWDHHDSSILKVDKLIALPEFPWVRSMKFSNIELQGASFTLGRYKNEDNFGFLMIIKELRSGSSSVGSSEFELVANNISINNSRFRLFDENQSYANKKGMDYADMEFIGINGFLEDFDLINDSLIVRVNMLKAHERSGFSIESLSTDYAISPTLMMARNSKIQTASSTLDFDLDFKYSSYTAMSDFIDSVDMIAEVRNSEIDMSELGYFSDILFDMPDKIRFSGSAEGTVRKLKGDNIVVEFGKNTSITADMYINGLPDFFNSFIRVGVQNFTTSICDIESFNLPIKGKNIDVPVDGLCDEAIRMRGGFAGYYADFESNINFQILDSEIDAKIKYHESGEDSVFLQSFIDAKDFMLGEIIGQADLIGDASFTSQIDMKGVYPDMLNINYGLVFSKLDFLGNKMKRLKFLGNYSDDKLTSDFRIGDKKLLADGSFIFSADSSSFSMDAEIAMANISGLGFWDKSELKLSSNLTLDIQGFDIDEMNAGLKLYKLNMFFGPDVYHYDSLKLTKTLDTSDYNSLKLESAIADIDLSGYFKISTLYQTSLSYLNNYYNFSGNNSYDSLDKNADLHIEIKDGAIINRQLIMGLDISKGSVLDLFGDFENDMLSLNAVSDEIKLFGIALNDNKISASAKSTGLNFNYFASTLIFKDSTEADKTVLGLDSVSFSADVSGNKLNYGIKWRNLDSTLVNYANIRGVIKHDSAFEFLKINKSDLVVNNINWAIDTSNFIKIHKNGVEINNINISADKSLFQLSGSLIGERNDTLEVSFSKWDLSFFDILSRPYNIDFDGVVDGYINIGVIGKNPTFISNIRISDFVFNGEYLGRAHILDTWDNLNKSIFLKAQIIDGEDNGLNEMFHANGYYYPFRDTNMMDVQLSFNDFKLPAVEPFMRSYVSELRGRASGEISLRGSLSEPELKGYAKINETSLVIKYLNTRYSFSNLIVFEKGMLRFDKLILFDTLGNTAKIKGFLKHDSFKNPELDVNISTDKLLFFNTTRRMNDLYYGTGILSGNLSITGQPDDIKLDINTSTKQGTRVFIPLDFTTEVSDKDYIIFVDHKADSLLDIDRKKELELKKNDELKYDISLGMGISPIARINISMPSNMGDIDARGTGDLQMNFNSDGEFNLFGEYIVDRGMFNFTIENLVNKRFELVKGGRISWTGDPYTAIVNIKGLYRVKANLNSLGLSLDSSASYKNKVNVECYINLKNQLLDPSIKFEITMPDLDPDLQRMVYAEIDTTNTAMMNQQMISLLVLGTFSYSNASNYNLASSYYTILTNQLSGMLSQISDDFDIGVNYKPGDNITNEEFEVALSTQLFDDRLIIDGNFGVTYDRSGQNASNIVGDVDIAYKLTEDGRWIMKAFNHSNVNSWYYYNNYDKVSPYTQGVGLAFRKEFNSVKELFRKKKSYKKRTNTN